MECGEGGCLTVWGGGGVGGREGGGGGGGGGGGEDAINLIGRQVPPIIIWRMSVNQDGKSLISVSSFFRSFVGAVHHSPI